MTNLEYSGWAAFGGLLTGLLTAMTCVWLFLKSLAYALLPKDEPDNAE